MLDRGFFAAALLATALGGLNHALVGTLSPRLITDLGDPDLYVLIAGGYLIATIGGALAAVPIARRFPGPLLLWVALVTLIGGLFFGLVSVAMWQLVFARVLAGVGAGLAFVATLGLAGRDARGAAFITAAFGAGFALGPAVGGAVTDLAGWRWAFAASLAVAIVAVVLVRRSGPEAAAADVGAISPEATGGAVPVLALAAASAAAFVGLLFLPLAAGAGAGGGWIGSAIVAVPLGAALVLGALALPRVGDRWAAITGLALLSVGLAARAALGSDRTLGALVAVPVGLGAGLVLADLARVARSASLHVAVRQASGLAGLALGAVVMLVVLRERLVANLRPIVDAVLVDVPAELQAFARAAAEQALRQIGDQLNAANLTDATRGFASVVIDRIPAEFQPAAEPYRDALNAAFADALRAGLVGAFLVGAGLAAVALVAIVAGRIVAGRRRAAPDVRESR